MCCKISIIVPIYNVENLLPKCLQSILNQTFKAFELILVNDGSTDNSSKICDHYARVDDRIRVIHKENGGTSTARNAGLAIAKGSYISFVDSDDFVSKNMFQILYDQAVKSDADLTICSYLEVSEGEQATVIESPDNNHLKFLNNKEAILQMYKSKADYINYVVPWGKLYKRELFSALRYEVGNIYDDETVAHQLLYHSHKIVYLSSPLYYYVQRQGSQMNSSFHVKRFDKIFALRDRATYFKGHQESELHEKALKHYMDMFFWYYYLAKNSLSDIDQELKSVKKTFDQNLLNLLKLRSIGWKQKIMCVLFSFNPLFYEWMKDMKNKKEESFIK